MDYVLITPYRPLFRVPVAGLQLDDLVARCILLECSFGKGRLLFHYRTSGNCFSRCSQQPCTLSPTPSPTFGERSGTPPLHMY